MIGPLGGGRIIPRSLKTTGNKNCFQPRPTIFFLKSYMTPLYLLKIVFPKFDPLSVTGMALCVDVDVAKMSTFIQLSLRLSGIEFCLVSDYVESS